MFINVFQAVRKYVIEERIGKAKDGEKSITTRRQRFHTIFKYVVHTPIGQVDTMDFSTSDDENRLEIDDEINTEESKDGLPWHLCKRKSGTSVDCEAHISVKKARKGDNKVEDVSDGKTRKNEKCVPELSNEILWDSEESGSSDEEEESSEEEETDEKDEEKKDLILDKTETNLISLRRKIYLIIHSSLDYEECAHKLMKMEWKPGQEIEICNMILDCCCEKRTYEKFFGSLAIRFCQINKKYIIAFQTQFKDSYDTVFRLKHDQLRNVAKFFAHLLAADAISWKILSLLHLSEENTSSAGRIFIKILLQELENWMGLKKLYKKIKDPTLDATLIGLFPKGNPKNTRFAINFFNVIGLGVLTR